MARPWAAPTDRARLGAARRHGVHALRAIDRAWGTGSARGRCSEHARPVSSPARAHALPRHRALPLGGDRPDLRRRWAPSSTPGPARRRRRSTRACSTAISSALDVINGHGLASGIRGRRHRARRGPRGDRDVRGRPAGSRLRRPRRGGLRRPSTRPAGPRAGGDRRGTPLEAIRRVHETRYVPANVVVAAAGAVDRHPRSWLGPRARRPGRGAPAPSSAAVSVPAGGGRATPASSARRPSSTTCASGATGQAHDERAPLRCACSTTSLGVPCLRHGLGGARAARLAYSVYSFASRPYAGTGQVGIYVGTRGENAGRSAVQVVADELPPRGRAGERRGAGSGAGERQGADGPGAGIIRCA